MPGAYATPRLKTPTRYIFLCVPSVSPCLCGEPFPCQTPGFSPCSPSGSAAIAHSGPPTAAEQAGQDPAGEGAVPGGDRVEQADGFGAHGGQVVGVDQDRAPAGPAWVALHHRRDNGVAGRDQVRARHRHTVVPDEPGQAGQPAYQRAKSSAGSGQSVHAKATGTV